MIATLQIIVSVALIILILIQERSSGLSGVFGGGGGEIYSQRRGLEKSLFGLTVFLTVSFAVLSLLNFVF
jgi:preprotein translocase subunit SecG